MPAIPVHHTATDDGSWDGPAAKTDLETDGSQAYYESAYAWRDAEGDATAKSTYKFIHHEVSSDGKVGAANVKACQSAIGVLNGGMGGSKIPDADRKGVWDHLAAHLKDAGVDVPELKSRARTGKSSISVQIKALSDDGSFEGKLAVYNNVDLGQDLIEPGAFKKTIAERGTSIPLLWQHDPDKPIGSLELIDATDALYVKGQLVLDVPEARTAYALLKARVIKGLSIGYDTLRDSVENGVRHLKELRLWEGSVVTFPMNEAAMVTAVKAKDGRVLEAKGDFNEELAENQLQSAGYQMFDALCTALCSLTWTAGLDNDQKAESAKVVIDQFSAAYLAYYPQYLDWLASEYGDMKIMGKLQHEHKRFLARVSGVIPSGPTDDVTRKAIQLALELKEGRVLSSATKKSLQTAKAHTVSAAGHMKDANDIFDALLEDEADDELDDDPETMGKTGTAATSETKAAEKDEAAPVIDHSAAEEILNDIRSLIPKR